MENISTRLSKRISIEQAIEVADGAGGRTQTWQQFAYVWAEILPRRASEDFFVGQLRNAVTHKITIRYLSGITENMRINYNDRIFRISSLINVGERNEIFEILAEEEKLV